MTDETIYTGPLPTQITGDVTLGKTYAREGRRMLGAMLSANGVNERIANGEPGGFFKRSVQMEDGTVVTVTTNDGFHVLRIDTPRKTEQAEFEPTYHTATGSSPHYVFEPEAHGSSPPPEVPLPGFPEREDVEEGEEKRKESSEYMWVGCRYTTPNSKYWVLGAMMIEPPTGPPHRGGPPLRGILDCIDWWDYGDIVLVGAGDDWTAEPLFAGEVSTIDEAVQGAYDGWSQSWGGEDNGHDRAERHVMLGTHAIPIYLNRYDAKFLVSANGLRCESINMWSEGMPTDTIWNGFDPTTNDQSGVGVRDVGDRHASGGFSTVPAPPVLWDAVFTLDPHENEQEYPYDSRPGMRGIRRALERIGMDTRILPGEYILALHSVDRNPGIASRRAGEVIPLYEDEAEDTGLPYRSAKSDYDEYMVPINAAHGLDAEVEVRLGKGEAATVIHFQTNIAESNFDDYANMPYGMDWHSPCSPIGGPNPAGPNFAPEYIAIDVLGGSARWVGKHQIDLYPILGGGVYSHADDDRKPFDIYVHVVPWSQPEQDNWAEYVGNALFAVLEAATAGVYGNVIIHDPGGEEGCRQIFDGASKSQLWKFDATEQSLTPLPVLSEMKDYPYGWQPDESYPEGGFMSPYQPEMFWYYPYKFQSKAACRNSVAIGITAVKGTYYFDTGQHVYFQDPPIETDCC